MTIPSGYDNCWMGCSLSKRQSLFLPGLPGSSFGRKFGGCFSATFVGGLLVCYTLPKLTYPGWKMTFPFKEIVPFLGGYVNFQGRVIRMCILGASLLRYQNPVKKGWSFPPHRGGYIWSRFAVRYHPPPHMVWSQNLRFAAFRMKTLYLQCFLHGGLLVRSATLQIRWIFATNLPKTCYLQCFGFDIVE